MGTSVMDHWVLEVFTCSYYIVIVVLWVSLIYDPNEATSAVSRLPVIVALTQASVRFKILEVQELFLGLGTYVP